MRHSEHMYNTVLPEPQQVALSSVEKSGGPPRKELLELKCTNKKIPLGKQHELSIKARGPSLCKNTES